MPVCLSNGPDAGSCAYDTLAPMSAEPVVAELTWRGLTLARSARLDTLDDGTSFLAFEAPLPVGARIGVAVAGGPPREARVAGVVELEAGAKVEAGMRLAWLDGGAAAQAAPDPVPEAAADAFSGPTDADDAEAGGEVSSGPDASASDTAPAGKKGRRRKRR